VKRLALLLSLLVLPLIAHATSTINSTNAYAWGANIGWTNWLADTPADGIVVGEFICSDWIYSAPTLAGSIWAAVDAAITTADDR
jgi:hypothetical protein